MLQPQVLLKQNLVQNRNKAACDDLHAAVLYHQEFLFTNTENKNTGAQSISDRVPTQLFLSSDVLSKHPDDLYLKGGQSIQMPGRVEGNSQLTN